MANHEKLELIIGDAHKYLMETTEVFDVIIMDISDPIEAGPGIALYTQEFYKRAAEVLNKKSGVFVTQAGCADSIPRGVPTEDTDDKDSWCFSPIINTLATVFDHAIPYSVPVPSFGEDWGFVMAFNGSPAMASALIDFPPAVTDALVEERIETVPGVPEHRNRLSGVNHATKGNKRGAEVLKHYDGAAHRGMFSLSKSLREAIKIDKRIIDMENPIFMY